MVAEIAADTGQGVPGGNADRGQILRIADAGDLQELRRVDGAAAQDDVAAGAEFPALPVLAVGDADGALALEVDRLDQGVGETLRFGRPNAGRR